MALPQERINKLACLEGSW